MGSMDKFWQKALQIGGIVTVVMFVIWRLYGDIIAKFSPISSENTTILTGMIITMLFLLASKSMDNRNKQEHNSSNNQTTNINRSVNISNGASSGNIITGDGNAINSTTQTHSGRGDKIVDSSVSVGGDNSGNIVTGDGNSINSNMD